MLSTMNAPQENQSNHSTENYQSLKCPSCRHYSTMITPDGVSAFKNEDQQEIPQRFYQHYTKQGFCWKHKDDLFVTRACGAFERKE